MFSCCRVSISHYPGTMRLSIVILVAKIISNGTNVSRYTTSLTFLSRSTRGGVIWHPRDHPSPLPRHGHGQKSAVSRLTANTHSIQIPHPLSEVTGKLEAVSRTILKRAHSWRAVVFLGAPVNFPGSRLAVAACLSKMRLTVFGPQQTLTPHEPAQRSHVLCQSV